MEKEYWFVILSGILSGTIVFGGALFARMGLSLYELATLPFIFTVIFLLPFVLFKKECRFKRSFLPLALAYGLVSVFVVLSQFGAIILGVPVAIIVLLLYTQPFWTIILSKLFLGEKTTALQRIACALVLIGVAVLVEPWNVTTPAPLGGTIVALIGGISLAGWVIIGSVASKRQSHPITSKFAETFFMLIFLAILYPLLSFFVHEPSVMQFRLAWPWQIWLYLLIFNIVAGVVNHLLYLNGVKKVPTNEAGIIMLLEPVSGAILAVIFLHQSITWSIGIGGFIILLANYLVIRNAR